MNVVIKGFVADGLGVSCVAQIFQDGHFSALHKQTRKKIEDIC